MQKLSACLESIPLNIFARICDRIPLLEVYESLYLHLSKTGKLRLRGELEYLRGCQGKEAFFESLSVYRMRNYHESVYRSGVLISWILSRVSGQKPSLLLRLSEVKDYPVPSILFLLGYFQLCQQNSLQSFSRVAQRSVMVGPFPVWKCLLEVLLCIRARRYW